MQSLSGCWFSICRIRGEQTSWNDSSETALLEVDLLSDIVMLQASSFAQRLVDLIPIQCRPIQSVLEWVDITFFTDEFQLILQFPLFGVFL